MSTKLYIIATPIGNLGDISARVAKCLEESEVILAEDTRVTLRLLNHLGLKKKLVSCHSFNEAKRLTYLRELALAGSTCALVCDAGTPLVSDPGHHIVGEAIACGITVIPIPGPSAFLLALVASGLECDRFCFEGFLADKPKERRARLELLAEEERTMVFYVAPHDLAKTVTDILTAFGNRKAALARELTKLHEEIIRGDLLAIKNRAEENPPRGECVLVVSGSSPKEPEKPNLEDIARELQELLDKGEHLKDASAMLASKYQLSRNEVYKLGIGWKETR